MNISKSIIVIILTALCVVSNCLATDYLSSGEVAAIGGGSLLIYGTGLWVNNFDSSKKSLIYNPLPGEKSIQEFLGGRYYDGKSNFLDSRFGSAVTPAVGAILLASMDISWPAENRGKGLSQDLFLYLSGLLATRGITELSKAMVARPRPYIKMIPEGRGILYGKDFTYDYNSFFSGHASSAFFVSTFLNKHTRMVMRRELNVEDYRRWRWLPPAIFYTWSSFVGWSRIHAWEHYFSDVAAGALVGWLMGELFYSFNDNSEDNNYNNTTEQTLFIISFKL
jgi:membrane-associated phospholipid phosphatase